MDVDVKGKRHLMTIEVDWYEGTRMLRVNGVPMSWSVDSPRAWMEVSTTISQMLDEFAPDGKAVSAAAWAESVVGPPSLG